MHALNKIEARKAIASLRKTPEKKNLKTKLFPFLFKHSSTPGAGESAREEPNAKKNSIQHCGPRG